MLILLSSAKCQSEEGVNDFFIFILNYKLFSAIYKPHIMLEAGASSPSLQEASTTKLLSFFPFLNILCLKEWGVWHLKGEK